MRVDHVADSIESVLHAWFEPSTSPSQPSSLDDLALMTDENRTTHDCQALRGVGPRPAGGSGPARSQSDRPRPMIMRSGPSLGKVGWCRLKA